jgi:hypothetical protein
MIRSLILLYLLTNSSDPMRSASILALALCPCVGFWGVVMVFVFAKAADRRNEKRGK